MTFFYSVFLLDVKKSGFFQMAPFGFSQIQIFVL